MRRITHFILFICIISSFLIYYFFIETLTISQIVKTTNNKENIFLNLFDFDIGLTRYDIYHLKDRSEYWGKRMKSISSIREPQKRQTEEEKLFAEMMADPSMKKITKNLFNFGYQASITILDSISKF